MIRTYTTKEIANKVGLHVNTVRFYEEQGLITRPRRQPNGYRIFTDLQLAQCGLIRLAMRAEVLQNGLRRKAVEIVKLCAALDMDASIAAADEYRRMIKREIENARAAIASVEGRLMSGGSTAARGISRREAASALGVTGETLRTWERSGLVSIGRGANGYRLYTPADMERLNVIRMLRCANYSLSAILRLLNRLEADAAESVETILNTPEPDEDVLSVCDRLIVSLNATLCDAEAICGALDTIKKKFSTLQ